MKRMMTTLCMIASALTLTTATAQATERVRPVRADRALVITSTTPVNLTETSYTTGTLGYRLFNGFAELRLGVENPLFDTGSDTRVRAIRTEIRTYLTRNQLTGYIGLGTRELTIKTNKNYGCGSFSSSDESYGSSSGSSSSFFSSRYETTDTISFGVLTTGVHWIARNGFTIGAGLDVKVRTDELPESEDLESAVLHSMTPNLEVGWSF
ncbi:MAG: hypothetical protein CMH54_04035 [Myxococcales bacterium]|nr:hypothetical protein [Myxococcales bacterium]